MTDLIAFLDESKKPVRDPATGRPSGRGDHYVVAAAIVIEGDTDIRTAINEVERRLGFPLHYADLRSRGRRLAAIAELERIGGWEGYLFETARPLPVRRYSEHHIRAKTLEAAFTALHEVGGVSRIVLETRATPAKGFLELDEKDHAVLQRLLSREVVPGDFTIAHADKTERMLAIADVLAGARSDYLCFADQEAYPLIAHRVRSVKTLFAISP